MGDFKSFLLGLYNTVKSEYRSRIFYGNEDSAFAILMDICNSAIGLVNENNLKYCFSLYVDTWTKTHVMNAELAQVKAALKKKYHATSAAITEKAIEKSLEIMFSHDEKLAKRLAPPADSPLTGVVCPNCGERLPEWAKFCGKCRTRIEEKDVRSSTPAPSISAPVDNNSLLEEKPKSYEKQADDTTEIITKQPDTTIENPPKQPERPKTVEPKRAPLNLLHSLEEKIAHRLKFGNSVPMRGTALTANSAQNFPLRLIAIVSSALVIITVGIIVALVLALGGGEGVSIPNTASFMAIAEKYLLDMNYEQAVLEFNKILEIDPMNVDAYLGKAEALIAMGKTDEARELLESAYTKTGNPYIFQKLQSLIQPPASSSSEGIDLGNSEPIEIEPPEPAEPVYQDPMCLAIEKTLTDYLNGRPITDTTNFNRVTSLYIFGNKVYVECGKRYGEGRVGSYNLEREKISYTFFTDGSDNSVRREETSGPLTDISFIRDMPKLKYLHIECQRNLKDISPLAGMKSITSIKLNRNGIVDISPLSDMTQLTYLHLFYNSISDISAVKKLTNLTTLYFGDNNISDISAIAGLTKLRNLWISENPIYNISAVSELTQLRQFVADECGFSDISALKNLTNLTDLSLDNNKISNISALSGLTALEDLRLDNNQISDISPISGLTALEYLHLDNNQISDISAFAKLYKLESLGLDSNQISDISPLSGLTNLDWLWLGHNKISDISPLSGLTSLTTLDLGYNNISNVSPLYKLTKLNYLGLFYNYASETDVKNLGKALGIDIIYLKRRN